MSNFPEISSSSADDRSDYLSKYDLRTQSLLRLGREDALADANTDPNRSHRAFRGIRHLNPSQFAIKPLSAFRGISPKKYNGFINPDYIPNDDPVFDNSYQDTNHPLNVNVDIIG